MAKPSELICPYCKTKQEGKATDYFALGFLYSENIQCDNCDELFNAVLKNNKVITFSNIVCVSSMVPREYNETI